MKGNETYTSVQIYIDEIVNTYKTDLAVKFEIACNKENMRLPRFFCFLNYTNCHLWPGARLCSMKQLLLNNACSCVKKASTNIA